jgi:hypothetical protein
VILDAVLYAINLPHYALLGALFAGILLMMVVGHWEVEGRHMGARSTECGVGCRVHLDSPP